MTKPEAKKRISKLRDEINHHRYLYHVLDKQEISDGALDSLKKELSDLEQKWPDLITSSSPTQRIGGQPLDKFKQVAHQVRMLSLQDAFTKEDLLQWATRNKKIINQHHNYFITSKIDGVAISLLYQNGELHQGVTRGDGRTGEDVTHNIKTIEAIPLQLKRSIKGIVEIRGEVYMLKKDFDLMNKKRTKAGQPPFANPRNIAAGSLRQLDPAIAASRPLSFFAWEIARGIPVQTREEEHRSLQDLGFPVPPSAKLVKNIDQAWRFLSKSAATRQAAPFLIDGAVIKVNNLSNAKRLGIVGKAPRGSIAFKYAAEEATTIVKDIMIQVGRTGALTPVAHLEPTLVAGSTVSRATLHNADEIKRKDIRIGDTVIIRKAGDIIPEVVRSLPKLRPQNTKPFRFPKQCPICHKKAIRDTDGVVIRCPNQNCFSRQRERVIHALSKSAFDIEGLGDKIIEQLIQAGLIKDAPDVWQLTVGDLTPLERFADKKADNIVSEIQSHKHITLNRFLFALSIPGVGTVTAQDLAREFKSLDNIQQATAQQLVQTDGIGDKIAQDIVTFFTQKDTKALINKYQAAGIKIKTDNSVGPLTGQTFVFTGSLGDMTREEAKQRVTALGGKVASTVGAKVTYLVSGDKSGGKINKAKQMGVKIISAKQFASMTKSQ